MYSNSVQLAPINIKDNKDNNNNNNNKSNK
jgi:hypothetical protein